MSLLNKSNRERIDLISRKLSAFGLGQVQDVLNVVATLDMNNIDFDEFISWVKLMRAEGSFGINQKRENSLSHYSCPDCGDNMDLFKVNSMPCNMVGGGYKSVLSCSDYIGCGYSRYSTDTIGYWNELINNISKSVAMESMIGKTKGCGGCGSK